MVKDKYNYVNPSEGDAGGVSGGTDNLRILPNPIYDNNCREKNLVTNSRNTKFQNKSFHHLKGQVPLIVYHQNIRGLRGKVNELIKSIISKLSTNTVSL
jgi:hypothetical protein